MAVMTEERESSVRSKEDGRRGRPARQRWLPTPLSRVVAGAAVVLLLAGVALLVVLALLDMRSNLAAQVELTEDLLERIGQQEALLERQVELSAELHRSSEEGLGIAREGVEVGEEGVEVGRAGLDVGREGLDIGYEGLELGRQMLVEIREVRDRMPQSPATVEEPAADLLD